MRGSSPPRTTLAGRLYGFRGGVIGGFITTIHHVGGGLWAFLGEWSMILTGGYELAFIISAVVGHSVPVPGHPRNPALPASSVKGRHGSGSVD